MQALDTVLDLGGNTVSFRGHLAVSFLDLKKDALDEFKVSPTEEEALTSEPHLSPVTPTEDLRAAQQHGLQDREAMQPSPT